MDTSPWPHRMVSLRGASGNSVQRMIPREIEPDAAPDAMTGPGGADHNPAHQSVDVRHRRAGMILPPSGAGFTPDGCQR